MDLVVIFVISHFPCIEFLIGDSWWRALRNEFTAEYFTELIEFIAIERSSATVYPPVSEVFSWTRFCNIKDIKVVILGQDPYFNANQAHGLCFSVKKPCPPPPSLLKIYEELKNNFEGFVPPVHGDLTSWAEQGVLLLNTVLTVRAGCPNLHKGKGWETFTNAVIKYINENSTGIVFLLWGLDARKKLDMIDQSKHHVLCSSHPSPQSAHRGFIGCKHFSKANQMLKDLGHCEIDWCSIMHEGNPIIFCHNSEKCVTVASCGGWFDWDMYQDVSPTTEVFRQALEVSMNAICMDEGFAGITKSALQTLTEITESYLTEIGRSTRQYCEIGGRAYPTFCDVQSALADAGFKINDIPRYLKRKQMCIAMVSKSFSGSAPNVLLVGERKSFPSYIPENLKFPKFPDPHTYVRTLTGQEVENNYSVLRESASSQKWDVERALTRFIAKTGNSHPLLADDRNAFPLIAAVATPIPYLFAVLANEVKSVTEELAEFSSTEEEDSENQQVDRDGNPNSKIQSASENIQHSNKQSEEVIDNPYLRVAKTSKLKKRPH